MTRRRRAGPLAALGAILAAYLAYPVAAFAVRLVRSPERGFAEPGLWPALWVSVQGATISLGLLTVTGIPLAWLLARRGGWPTRVVGVVVQLPLALPPLMGGIILVYLVGPYTFLGRLSGQRLTQTLAGVVIAQSFVSAPFLIVAARNAFAAVDPALGEVAATLGHGPLARFLRVDVPAAADGIRSGMVLLWLRAFGEYGSTVVLAYHPYTLPVYTENQFGTAPLTATEAPAALALAVALVAVAVGQVRRPARARRPTPPATVLPPPEQRPAAVGFDLDLRIGTFHLVATHRARSHRLAVIGPSGSGKSMLLRAIGGLLPDGGSVVVDGRSLGGEPPERRGVGYVPQGLGLQPGRTVWQQVSFGVGTDPRRAAWWLRTLGLDGLGARLPEQLSGGQRQRVSLARALARDPEVVLLDEPLSALDAPVRAELRRELRRLQRHAGLSTVLVTHDPLEAAMLADEIVVLRDGRVLQAGACRDLFRTPASIEVGRLLGVDNLGDGIIAPDGSVRAPAATDAVPAGVTPVPAGAPGPPAGPGRRPATGGERLPAGPWTGRLPAGSAVLWQVPAESLRLDRPGPTSPASVALGRGTVSDVVDLGRVVEVAVDHDEGVTLRCRTGGDPGLAVGDRCGLWADGDAISVWAAGVAAPPSDGGYWNTRS